MHIPSTAEIIDVAHASAGARLLRAVSPVCPVVGVAIGVPDDPNTWRVDYADHAEAPQRAAAEALKLTVDLYGADAIKPAMLAAIDKVAEAVRAQYATPNMDLTYSEKFAQAQAVAAMGEAAANAMSQVDREADFPTLSASVGLEAPTLWECAQRVLAAYAAFAQLSLVIERTRIAGKQAVSAASDRAAVIAAYEALTWPTP